MVIYHCIFITSAPGVNVIKPFTNVCVSMLSRTHPSRSFFVLYFMYVRLRVQGFGSSVKEDIQKECLIHSKTKAIKLYNHLWK
jgi:hypothetical protein